MLAGFLKIISKLCIVTVLSTVFIYIPALAQAGPTHINISGVMLDPSGSAILNPSVNFKIELYDKAGTCLLYSENHSAVNLSNTKGGFSLEVGAGTGIQNLIDGSSPTAISSKVYENNGAVAGGWAGCLAGTTLNNGDERLIRVKYDLGGGFVTMTPDVPLAAAAYAVVAETLQGKRPSDFIQVHNDATNKVTQANVENVFSSVNYPKLTALLGGTSGDYIPSTPTSAVGFNNQRITNVATPTGASDAANKGYVDGFVGGKAVDVSGVGPATGNGFTLVWDQAQQKWVAGAAVATDNTKLPLAGGTMSGAITMGGFDILGTGHITMSPQKTLTLGTFTTAQETTLVGTLTAANKGASWYNSTTNTYKIWDGTTAVAISLSGATAGGDLTGTYPNPTIANDKITSAKVDSAGVGINRLVISDQTTGANLKFATCANNEVLRYEGANGWICRDPSAIVTFPVTSVNGKTGVVVLNANDLGLGTAALENVGTAAGNVPQLDAGGKLPASVIPTLGSNYIVDGGNTRGAAISVGTNDNFALNFRTNNANVMTVLPSGNVGIGVAAPTETLAVANNISATGDLIAGGSIRVGPGGRVFASSDWFAEMSFPNAAGSNTADIALKTSNTARLTVKVDGKVGVGTTTPARLLDVAGPMRIAPAALPGTPGAGDLAFDSGSANALKYYDGSAWQTVATAAGGSGDFMKNGSVAMTGDFDGGGNKIKNVSNIGIGTATPNTNLTVTNLDSSGTLTNFTQAVTNNGINIQSNYGSGAVYTPGLFWSTADENPTKPKAGMWTYLKNTGSVLQFGTSNSYATGITNGSLLIDENGNVGVNQGVPSERLDVRGNARVLNGYFRSDETTATQMLLNSNGTYFGTIQNDANNTWSLGYKNNTTTALGTPVFTWNSSGKVGIGTSTPTETLELVSSSNSTNSGHMALRNTLGFTNSWGGLKTMNDDWDETWLGTTSTGFSNYAGYPAGAGMLRSYSRAGLAIGSGFTGAGSNLMFLTNGDAAANERMRITSAGNVGIGTTTPARVLHVNGPMRITPAALPGTPAAGDLAFDSGASNALKFYDGSAWQTVGTGSGSGDFMKNGSVAMTGNFNAGGNSILGNTTASASLTLESTSNATKGYVNLQPNGGNVGIGTASPSVKLDVNGNANIKGELSAGYTNSSGIATSLSVANNAVAATGTGTSIELIPGDLSVGAQVLTAYEGNSNDNAYLAFTTRGSDVVTERFRITSAGDVGIGTNAPARILHVNGPMRITPAALPGTPGAGDLAFDSGASNALKFYDGSAWQTVGTGSGSGDFMKNGSVAMTGDFNAGGNRVLGNSTASANLELESTSNATKGYVLLQKNGGDVGIGTTAPIAKLHVAGGSIYGAQGILTNQQYGFGDNSMYFDSQTSGNSSYLRTVVNNSEILRLLANGNVGVGTSAPVARLDVKGAGNTTSTYGLAIQDSAGTYNFFVRDDGAVAIGTTNPLARLHVQTSTTDIPAYIGSSDAGGYGAINFANDLAHFGAVGVGGSTSGWPDVFVAGSASNIPAVLITNNSEKMRISADGWVGIGTTAPARLLHVNGPMRITPAALPGSPAAGDLAFDSGASNALKFYDGSAWQTVGAGSGSGDFLRDGSLAMTGDFNAGGNKVLGNTTASADLILESTSNATKGNVLIQPTSGKVGIGTTAPLMPLHVNGGIAGNANGYNLGGGDVLSGTFEASPGVGGANYVLIDSSAASRGSGIVFSVQKSGKYILGNDIDGVGVNDFSILDMTANQKRLLIDSAGSVGIGTTTTSTNTRLEVNGQIHTPSASIATGAVDFVTGHAVTTSFDCGSNITLANVRDGSSYTLVVTGTGTTQCNFSTTTTGDDAATVTYRFVPANGARTASSHTIYSLVRVGTIIYISWITGF